MEATVAAPITSMPRTRATCRTYLATAQLSLGDLDQACASATRAAEIAETLGGARVTTALSGFARKLQPYRDSPTAAFLERTRPLLRAV